MIQSNQLSPGITISLDGKIYRVESCVKVTVSKGTPFFKTKLKSLTSDETVEKNFKACQSVQEVSLAEKRLEYLYPEDKDFLFLDIGTLDQVKVPTHVVGDKVNYLKEGTEVRAMFYGDTIFSLELPQFLELMIVKTENGTTAIAGAQASKVATVETGARIEVPQFIEAGDIIKVDTQTSEYIQRV